MRPMIALRISRLRDRPKLRSAWTVGAPVSIVAIAVVVSILHPETRGLLTDTLLGQGCAGAGEVARCGR